MSKLHEWEIKKLHPTQITVGLIEVDDRRRQLQALKKHEQKDYLLAHPMPAVTGPEGRLYITDHHHLGRAAWELDIDNAFFTHEGDLSSLEPESFWREMLAHHWAHPYDQNGALRPWREIPRRLDELRDDPYRSLACFVRRAGGFDKTPTAFAEFLWADFFRRRVPMAPGLEEFKKAVSQALALAHSPEAASLPGYRAS